MSINKKQQRSIKRKAKRMKAKKKTAIVKAENSKKEILYRKFNSLNCPRNQ